MVKISLISFLLLGLVGCISQPQPIIEPPKVIPHPPSIAKEIHTPTGVVIKPYEQEEIKRQQMPPKPHVEQRIVIPQQKNEQKFNDGSQLPAFKNLIQQAEIAIQHNQISQAEGFALQAQRLAPQTAQTYLTLSKISLAKNDKVNALSFAQRGLSFTPNENLKKQLNQIIRQTQ
ncbi:hypothetical protein B9T31_07655 [Acinetobacter sp. ANC 4558]|uniref:hypothetical protein n=1 Tax=Acinetobacter sp. ANC 4558 TaxID=1977876 RepID=UPI000A35876E|nr:hypothetical protein [Acinetobacter sp. ANC 4558]OTG86367.1 hypothetical protein B9T31_07655 [Acinetobacter sp. ANC 4558]